MLKDLLNKFLGRQPESTKPESKLTLYAPMEGSFVPLKEVKDPVFSTEMLGKGVAVEPSGDTLYAPATGKVLQVFGSKHAVTMEIDGAEVLLHVGIDTVNLQGKGFEPLVQDEQMVEKGQALLKFDPEVIRQEGCALTTMMVVCNSDQFKTFDYTAPSKVEAGTSMLVIGK